MYTTVGWRLDVIAIHALLGIGNANEEVQHGVAFLPRRHNARLLIGIRNCINVDRKIFYVVNEL